MCKCIDCSFYGQDSDITDSLTMVPCPKSQSFAFSSWSGGLGEEKGDRERWVWGQRTDELISHCEESQTPDFLR